MPTTFVTGFIPENLRWWGIGRELVIGTPVVPSIAIPSEKGEPQNKPEMLPDNGVRGMMGVDYGVIQGVEIADFPLSGNVYLDTIGYLLHNLMGDYQAVGTSPTSATTVALATAAGATSFTVGAIGSIVIGSVLQFGNATLGTAPTENLIVTNVAGSVVTFANTPTRFAHGTNAAVAIVTAPFTHTFSLLNSGNGQGPSHTLTFHDGLAGTFGARQYPYWKCSGIDFKAAVNGLFMHDTKGTSMLGQIAGSSVNNGQSFITAVPNWLFKVGIGGPASGGTLVSTVQDATLSIAREVKPQFGMAGQQAPIAIPQLGLTAKGKLTFMAADESPLLAYLNNTVQQLQLALTQGSGPTQLGVTFNFQTANYMTAVAQAPDVMKYEVDFEGFMNATDAGASGGRSPCSVSLINAIGSY